MEEYFDLCFSLSFMMISDDNQPCAQFQYIILPVQKVPNLVIRSSRRNILQPVMDLGQTFHPVCVQYTFFPKPLPWYQIWLCHCVRRRLHSVGDILAMLKSKGTPSKSMQALGFHAILKTNSTGNSIQDVIAQRPEAPEMTVFWIFSLIQRNHSSEQANPRSAGERQFQSRGLLLSSWTWREAGTPRHCLGLTPLCSGRSKEISYSLGHPLS